MTTKSTAISTKPGNKLIVFRKLNEKSNEMIIDSGSVILLTIGMATITQIDLDSLNAGRWLTDTIITFQTE